MSTQWYLSIDGVSQRVVNYLPLLGAFHSPKTAGTFWLPLLLCADEIEAVAVVDAMRLYDADTLQHWKAEMHCDPLTQHPGGEAALIATRANTAEAYARSCPVGADGWPLLPLVRHAIQFRDAHRQITAPSPAVNEALDDATWRFSPGAATYKTTKISVNGIRWNLLKSLVELKKALTVDDLISAGWEHDSTPDQKTVRTHLSELRKLLRKQLHLPKGFNPIPNRDRGALSAWELDSTLR